jgi:hypothetical protein
MNPIIMDRVVKIQSLLAEAGDLLGKSILAEPSGLVRNMLTESNIHVMVARDVVYDALEQARKENKHA